MIRINLLSREERRRKAHVKVPQIAIIAVAMLAVGGMGGYWYFVKWEVQQLRADVVATRSEIAGNQEIIRLVEQYTRDKKLLQDRLAIIQQLAAAQHSPVRLLDGISQALPEGGWLTGISKVSGRLVIRGYASSHFVVAELMLALQRLKSTINNVELNFSELELYEGKPVERFEILATLSG
ncbi:PilN domain-containing protein [Candidatus Methylomirabilis sp.]|uniref:PilN domain-containing protein n=1 Tax=Candidatus Methylomirabilis tolerans TaxID=3123416 RepID=A0AAJ1AKS1_9BACT|nr:PilN domain-containing protein [Candidatus Methylomirabilis sp.]